MSAPQIPRVAINGMGRIGRSLFRLLLHKKLIHRLVVVNEIMSKENLIYLLKFDSIRGQLPAEISSTENGFRVDDNEIIFSQVHNIGDLAWQSYGVDTVVEATGIFTQFSDAKKHLDAGAKRVLLTTFSKDIPAYIWRLNSREISSEARIISPGDCTINCVSHLIGLMDKTVGVDSVHINVIQGYTTRQQLLDAPYKGLRRGRAAAHSIIPFEVNSKPILESIFPSLKGKIESMSTRVPVSCGAIADLSFVLKNSTTSEQVNSILKDASQKSLDGICAITFEPIVSSDILGNPHSCLVDGLLTKISNGNHLKLLAWFDNEWGYANRLLDWLHFFSER